MLDHTSAAQAMARRSADVGKLRAELQGKTAALVELQQQNSALTNTLQATQRSLSQSTEVCKMLRSRLAAHTLPSDGRRSMLLPPAGPAKNSVGAKAQDAESDSDFNLSISFGMEDRE